LQLPFFERVEYMINSFELSKTSNGYLQYFMDEVFEFQIKKRATIQGFLEFWEEKKDKLSLVAPDAQHSVRIMTIHKAKGLEFPVVIFPYDIDIYHQIKPKVWIDYPEGPIDSVLVNYGNKLKYLGQKGIQKIEERKEQLEFDNFNLLYVTMTRAVEQLYIVTAKNLTPKNEEKTTLTSGLFINYLKDKGEWDDEKMEYYFGSPKRKSIPKKKDTTTVIQEQFISNLRDDNQITIAKNASLLWETDREVSINYGNLIHEILSKITTGNDIAEVVEHYVYVGILSAAEKTSVLTTLNDIVKHPELAPFFEQNNKVYNEQEIVTPEKKIIIPDRIIIKNGKATIIDYKTGSPSSKHKAQIKNYANALSQLGFQVQRKILVYIDKKIVVEEV